MFLIPADNGVEETYRRIVAAPYLTHCDAHLPARLIGGNLVSRKPLLFRGHDSIFAIVRGVVKRLASLLHTQVKVLFHLPLDLAIERGAGFRESLDCVIGARFGRRTETKESTIGGQSG